MPGSAQWFLGHPPNPDQHAALHICQWRRLPAAREIRAALRPERNCAISQSSVESFGRCPVGMNKGHRLEECAHLIVGSQPGSCAFNLRSEEHTSELQSLMRTSYDVLCLKEKNI